MGTVELDQEKLAGALKNVKDLIKSASELAQMVQDEEGDEQPSEELKEAADDVVDKLVETGNLDVADRKRARRNFLHDKKATFNALMNLAEEAQEQREKAASSIDGDVGDVVEEKKASTELDPDTRYRQRIKNIAT